MSEESTSTIPTIKIPSVVTVKDFAQKIDKPVSEIITVLLQNGFLASINETLDFETVALIADELEFKAVEEKINEQRVDVITPEQLAEILEQEKEAKNLQLRPPIVTILGHVDHGKTTLLDAIRKTKVVETESGGITQNITAYQVKVKNRLITFVDTPGHQAFSKMRARGGGLADISVLIVAADDGVRPQTKEVIKNLQASKSPIIVAINKIDKPGANVEKVKGQLTEAGILLEKRGGKVPVVEISAKNKINIDELLETILLSADIIKITADWERTALGIILESHLDQRRGALVTAIIKTGTLNEGDSIIAGDAIGTARQILDFNRKRILKASPGSPITIIGLDNICKAGSVLQVEESRTVAKKKTKRSQLEATGNLLNTKVDVKRINESMKTEDLPKLNIILKADAGGSLEAIKQVLETIPQDEVLLNILSEKVGNITETDIQLATASEASIYGFKVVAPSFIKQAAKKNEIEIKIFEVIYKMIDEIKEQLSDLLEPEIVRTDLGQMKVLAVFRTEKTKMIVGGKIIQGKVTKDSLLEIKRDEKIIGKGKITQLRHNQDNVEEGKKGMECGLTYSPEGEMTKIKEGDLLKFYLKEEKKRKIK
ncbi:MAG: translation initiation factor IF-2 [Patescibacteria group bacterium]|nr:translation initiation factor IF-2 [Patescibacteria group bacterium]